MKWNIGENDEIIWIQAAQQGDREALEHLLREYSRMVRAEAHMFALRGADSEDMIQEGMLALFSAVETFSPEKCVPFPAYARLCIERRLRSFFRSVSARKHEPLNQAVSLEKPLFEDLSPYSGVVGISDPESFVIGREEYRETLEHLFDLLSHFEAQVLQLYLYGLSYDEIALRVNKPRKSVLNAIQRIHKKAERL